MQVPDIQYGDFVTATREGALPKVAVFLAVYNGQTFLERQISSILGQRDVVVTLYISVDKSTDQSIDICSFIAARWGNVNLLPYGKRYGSAALNFYEMIRIVAEGDNDYVSFADQDDVWLSDKLSRAHSVISSVRVEGYSSCLTAFDESGNVVKVTKAPRQTKYDFIFESASAGCTYVLRGESYRKLREFVIDNYEYVKQIRHHDMLIYAYFRSIGFHWYIDRKSHIYYRLHSNNSVGLRLGFRQRYRRLIMLFNGEFLSNSMLLAEMYSRLHHESPAPRTLIKFWLFPFSLRRKLTDSLILWFAVLVHSLFSRRRHFNKPLDGST